MSDVPDYPRAIRGGALGARLRRVSERIDRDSTRIYANNGVRFEQRWFGLVNQLVLNEAMTVGEIATALRITHASVSQARRSLEAAGLVSSRGDVADARRRILELTDAGRALVRELAPLWQALSESSAKLNAESGDVVALLDRLEAALDASSLADRVEMEMAGAADEAGGGGSDR